MKKILYLVGIIILAGIIAVASMVRPDIPVEKLKAKYADGSSKFISIDGLSVHYRDEGKGFPIVLLHGAASSLQTWDVWVKDLSKDYRVIRLDLPGYGLTGPNAGKDYSMHWYVNFLDTFLDKINVKNCYLAGNSLGGHIAGEFAFEHKYSVKKLILIDSGGYPLEERGILAVKMARTPLLRPIVRYATPRFFVAMNLRQVYGPKEKISDEIIDTYYELLRREGNRETFIDVCNRKPEDSSSHIRAITIPALILWGSRDSTIPARHAELFHRDMPNSKVIVYDGAGHVPHEEIPEKTVSDVRTFLSEQTTGKE
jgi:pimeloyl-ACP methyl ester carboxylesterase